jgi:uncharacterized membrane protein
MIQRATWWLATLATGLAAGFFYAYQVSVTRGTALVDDATYVATMQAINQTVRSAEFAFSFFGALAFLAAALVVRLRRWRSPGTWLIGAALALYLATFLITMTVSVPLNNRLAEGTVTRTEYESAWNRANAARTATAVASFAALLFGGLVRGGDGGVEVGVDVGQADEQRLVAGGW